MLNVTTIQGRLTKEPEMKQMPSGIHHCFITIASQRPKKKTGESTTDFIPAIAWAKMADFICQYFHKGDMIIATGRLQSRQYDGADGKSHTAYELSISEVNFAGGKAETAAGIEAENAMHRKEINWDEIPDLPDAFE